MDVDSVVGHGSTFRIHLPVSHQAVMEKSTSSADVRKGSETILFVDDEEILTEFAEDLLGRLGYTVLIARSGKEAIEIYDAQKETIDVVLLDMVMPDMGGEETYESLKKMDPKVMVLLSSGYSIDGQATAILNKGCNGFIQKTLRHQNTFREIEGNSG